MRRSLTPLWLATACSTAALVGTSAARADEIYSPTTANGYRIYMSPARHTDAGARGECRGYNENTMSYWNAHDATQTSKWPTQTLTGRGYLVRIGTQTYQDAVNNSNVWGADRHVTIHSNAKPGGCGTTTASVNGTWVIYYSGSVTGKALATSLKNAIGPYSPGTADRLCIDPTDGCFNGSLYELSGTSAPAAYIEAEFHTWDAGVEWLWMDTSWQWRIAEGIDAHLGRPR